jgi:ATP-dependent exoDNAse (exonuclease V) beta subunit
MQKTVEHNGIKCFFDEQWHSYRTSTGKKLVSGTKYLKQFFKEFDAQSISKTYAAKRGLEQQDVLNMWGDKAKRSQAIGNACHLYAEKYFTGQHGLVLDGLKHSPHVKDLEVLFPVVGRFIDSLLQTKKLIECEKIVFSERNGVAGTIDLLMHDDYVLYLFDWKSNEKIDKENSFQNCLGPLWPYPDCNYIKYAAQLNLYREILVTENYFPQFKQIQMCLFHITPKGIVEIPVEPFPLPIKFLEG